jgi:4'-phosphopantetheinyl transferase EntD
VRAADPPSDAAASAGSCEGALACDSWIGDLFPEGVLTRASRLCASEADLLPEERRLLGGAVPARRREFATGRVLARELLARLGHPRVPLLRGEDRLPRWPEGVVGSISHTADLCVVAVAPAGRGVRSLGVDVEPDAPLEPELWPEICGTEEIGWLRGRPAPERGGLARLVFSAKESLYKCVHPVTRAWLGFRDVRIDFSPETRTFSATLGEAARQRHLGLARLPGAFARRGGWIFTAVTWR